MRLTYVVLALAVLGVTPSYAEICSKPYNKVFACPKDSPHAGEFYCSWITPCSHDGVDSFIKEYRCLVASANSGCPTVQSCLQLPDCGSPRDGAKHSERQDALPEVASCTAKTHDKTVCVRPPGNWSGRS
jgi:hypothetical protein